MFSVNRKQFTSLFLVILLFLGTCLTVYADFATVSERTPAVRDAIVAAVSGVDNPSDITEAHLAAITSLNLRSKGITTLKSGDFSGMAGLTNLNLHNNELSSLPDGIFIGLTALTTIRLGGNTVDPLSITVSLEVAGEDQFKAVVPTGSPFAITLPISVSNGNISGDAMTLTIAQGSVESDALTLTRTADTTEAVSVNIGTLPSLPSNHYGYTLSKPDTLPLEVIGEVDTTKPIDPVDPPVVPEDMSVIPPVDTAAAPVFTDGTATIRAIAENSAAAINIGTAITATDANNDDITYSLSGTDAGAFSLDSTTGQLMTKAALDYEMKRIYVVTITASDGTLTDTISVIIRVIDVADTVFVFVFLPVSDRTPQVRDAIVAAVPGITDAANVTDTHLAAITSLNLRTAAISDLKSGDFSGLSGLTNLNLFDNILSSLPNGIFSGLTSLTTLRLGGNLVSPFPLIVSLQQVGINEYRAVIPTGAPSDIVVPINGAGTTTMVTIEKGSVNSAPFTVMNSAIVSIGDLPGLPANHFGYVLSKSTVCNRTLQVLEALAAAVQGVTDCRNLTDTDLATITSLDLSNASIKSLQRDDFAGLLTLSSLDLSNNQLSSLPDGIFSGLTGLTVLSLDSNTVDPFPLTVSLEKVGTNQVKAVIPVGAPFDMMLPIIIENGSLDGNVSSIAIKRGRVESMVFTVLRTSNAIGVVTADIGTLPNLPVGHTGYSLSKTDTLPLEIFQSINIAPVFTEGTTATRTIAENTGAGISIGSPVSATDRNNDELTFTLSGTDAAAFDIVNTSGELQTKAALDYETKNSYSVTITVSDGMLTDTISVTINVTDVDENRAPMFTDGDSTTRSIAENTAPGENIGTAISATDADDDTLTYSLGGTDASAFAIETKTGQLKTSAALDYESKSAYSVILTVSDGKSTDTINVTIGITNVDEEVVPIEGTGTIPETTPTNNAPEFTDGDSITRSVSENTGSGVDIGAAVSATDADGHTLTYTLGGTDASSFSIDSTSGQIRTSTVLDYESKTSYSVTVTVSDGELTDTISVTINVTDVDERPANIAPEFTDGDSTTREVAENTDSGVEIGVAVSATDADNDALTYGLIGTDASSFSIDSSSGQLHTSASLDYETKLSYTITITVSDGNGGSDSISVTINVTNVNEAPAFADGSSTTRAIAENLPSDINVGGAVTANDPDGDTLTYTLGGTDAASFSIDTKTGQLKTKVTLDFETKVSYSVTISVSDGRLGDTIAVTISVTNLDETPSNTPPVFEDGSITERSIAENTEASSNIGVPITATDADNNTLAYPISGTDASSFAIDSETGQLKTSASLDHETKDSYTVVVTVSDGSGTSTITVTINVTDVNEAPVIVANTETTLSIPENTEAGENIGSVLSATDEDDGDTLTYTLGGTDAASFDIVSTNGQLQTKVALDYETKASYSVSITVSDGELTDTINVTINVSDVDENRAPVFTDGESTTRSIAENTGSGVDIGSAIGATDADNDDLTYSLGGTDADSFSINSTNGQLRTSAALDYESKKSYSVAITVSDGNGGSDSITVTINVIDVDENRAPVFTDGESTTREVAENTASGENIGNAVAATDADDDDLTYTLGGTDASSFDIVSISGQLQTKASLDYETKTSYTVEITVSDGNGKSDSIDVTINVTDVDENHAPVFAEDSVSRSILIDSSTAVGANIGTPITATDADDDTLTYSVGGTDASFFNIVSTSGQLQTTASFLSGTKTNYAITVTADDGNGGTDSVEVSVRAAGRTSQQQVNSPPTFTDGDSTTREVAENTAAGENIGTPVAATDANSGDTLTYTLGGTDSASFSIVSTSGQLQTSAALDYETTTSYMVTISVSDANGGTDSITVTINVTDVVGDIVPVANRTSQVRDAIVAAIENVDDAADVTEEHLATITLIRLNRKSISSLKSGDFSGLISLTHLHLQDNSLTSLPEDIFDGLSSLINLYLQNNDIASLSEDIFDGVSSVDNLWLANNELTSLPEDVFDGMSALRHLHLEDNDITGLPADIFDGLTMLWDLDLENNEITDVSAVEDLTSLAILSLAGNSISDYGPLRILKEANPDIIIDITIPADPDAPVFSDGATTTRSVAENTAAAQNIGTAVTATDSTTDDTLTYTLGGTDAGSFSIVSSSGQLQTKASLDYETKRSYSVTITVTDMTNKKDVITVTINVTNVSEISPAISARTSQVQTAIIAAIEGVDSAADVTDLQLAAITHLNLSSKSISSLKAGDFAGMSSLRYLDLSGNSISSLPEGVFDDLSSIFNLNLKNNSISDVSELEDLTSLVFLFLAGNSISDYAPLRRLKTNSQVAIDITIPPSGNQAPLFTGRPIVGRLIAENTEAGVLVGTITATDADDDDLTYTFGGKDADSFTFESETARIKTKAALDYETKRLYVVTVFVSDGNGGTDTITVHITVTNVSEISPAISTRTSQVQTAIIAAINGVDNADDVIDTQLAAIKELSLISKSINSLKVGDFAGMSSLEEIFLQQNSITSLPENVFDSLSSLEVIRLSNNSISSLPEAVFDGLSSLEELQLGDNSISSLPEDVFDGLSSLEDLRLGDNSISSLPEDIFDGLSSLENLRLNDNSISSLPADVFEGLSSLEDLWLSDNSISSLPEDVFDGLSSLELCILEGNSISSVPDDVFDGLSSLTNINLKNNSVTILNEEVFDGLSKLTYLHLPNNGLTSLPEDVFDGLSALKYLYLEDNSLSSLSEDIFDGLTSVTDLYLSGNSLSSLPSDVFDGMSALRDLNLSSNSLSSLPSDVFDGLSELWALNLKNNSITDVSALEGLTGLTLLLIEGNSISDYGPLRALAAAGVIIDITIPSGAPVTGSNTEGAPDTTALFVNFPNPFNPETWIPYQLAKPSEVSVTIYDIRSNVVRKLQLGHQRAGFYTSRSSAAHWDGRNKLGERVANGIYFYQLQTDTTSPLRKMVILQ